MAELLFGNVAETSYVDRDDWKEFKAYRFILGIVSDGLDGYSALVLNLPPGVGSCGDTEEEAVTHAREAIRGVLDGYAASGEPIPWKEAELPKGAKRKVIIVNA